MIYDRDRRIDPNINTNGGISIDIVIELILLSTLLYYYYTIQCSMLLYYYFYLPSSVCNTPDFDNYILKMKNIPQTCTMFLL